ncbi:MAG: ABC transporter permease [Pirellulaceae bacterium]
MKKILTIAIREYKAMVATKAFVLSIVMMPILMLGGLLAIQLLNNVGEVKERKIVVADGTGTLLQTLQVASDARNSEIDKRIEEAEQGSEVDDDLNAPSLNRAEKYFFESVEGSLNDDLRLELSDRVRDQELYAFLEIPDEVLASGSDKSITFYSQDSGLSSARRWIQGVISETAKQQRLSESEIDPQAVAVASAPVSVKGKGLVSRATDGSISGAEEKNELAAIFIPMGVMMLMFMIIFMASQPMLESVLEEKSQRIAEVLLGSANPFQLMSGKLLGSVAGSITIFSIYMVGIYYMVEQRGYLDDFPMHVLPWFIVFQILGVLFYAAIFLAVGACVSQLKEAQSMLLPVWMMLMSPMFIWFFIVQDPNGSISKWFSLFPPVTPTTMILRMSTGQSIPVWQPILGIILTSLATVAIVTLAGRIFRVGILWQGKTPKISEILRWGLTG